MTLRTFDYDEPNDQEYIRLVANEMHLDLAVKHDCSRVISVNAVIGSQLQPTEHQYLADFKEALDTWRSLVISQDLNFIQLELDDPSISENVLEQFTIAIDIMKSDLLSSFLEFHYRSLFADAVTQACETIETAKNYVAEIKPRTKRLDL